MDGFKNEIKGVPMVFEGQGEDGWGVCTLASIKPLGWSRYTEYEFKLPRADNVLQLALGQQLTLCCLDSADNVAKRNYYTYSPKKSLGTFSVVASEHVPESDVEKKKRRARGEGDFVSNMDYAALRKCAMYSIFVWNVFAHHFSYISLRVC